MNQKRTKVVVRFFADIAAMFLICLAVSSHAQDALDINPIHSGIYVISGAGGNVTVFNGSDGTFIIDDNFAHNGEQILKLIESVEGDVPKFLVNTHFHGDHAGGNQFFGEKGATIVAHENVRKRLVAGSEVKAFNMITPPAEKTALPSITFENGVDLHVNDERVQLVYVAHAHTDTDSFVYFHKANVFVLGDLMFNGFFPFIDIGNGGSLKGVITGLSKSLELMDADSIVVPGHGAVGKKADVQATVDTLQTAYDRLLKLKSQGKSLTEAMASKPLADIEKQWGGAIFTADQWIGLVWPNL